MRPPFAPPCAPPCARPCAPTRPTRRVLLGLVGAGGALHGAWAAAPAAGHVEETRGAVQGERDAARRSLAPPDAVYVGETVLTGENARAALRLGGHTLLRLGARARLHIDRFMAAAGGELRLDDGALLLDKDPAATRAPVTIRGPFGLIAVRGTRLFAGPSNGVTGVLVLRGAAEVTGGGQRVHLGPGEGTDVAAPGAAPSAAQVWGPARIAAALAGLN